MRTKVKLYPEQKQEPQMWNYPDGVAGPQLNVGDFAMMRGSLVEIEQRKYNEARGYIYEVGFRPIREWGINCEGVCFWNDESEFTGVTDPVALLQIEVFLANRRLKRRATENALDESRISAIKTALTVINPTQGEA